MSAIDRSLDIDLFGHGRGDEHAAESRDVGESVVLSPGTNAFVQQPRAAEVADHEGGAIRGHFIGEASVHRIIRQNRLRQNTASECPRPAGNDGGSITGVGDCGESARCVVGRRTENRYVVFDSELSG